jgi:flavine halogenase
MRTQSMDVLSDVDEDNFDRAFDLIRPSKCQWPRSIFLAMLMCCIVIQGTADVNKKMSEDEVQKTMDFVKNVFAPTDPEMHAAVQARVDPKFFQEGSENILLQSDLDRMFEDEDTKHVLAEVNARKPIHAMYDAKKNFASEVINGYTIHLETGNLSMVPA